MAVIAQNLSNDVDFVVETFGEQRTDRTIGQTRNQSFLFGRAALALEEAAGDAARARIFFLIVDGRSEEHTSELQSLMRISYAVFCLKKKKKDIIPTQIEGQSIANTLQQM